MKKYFGIYIIISIFMVSAAASAFSQDAAPASKDAKVEVPAQAPAARSIRSISAIGSFSIVYASASLMSEIGKIFMLMDHPPKGQGG